MSSEVRRPVLDAIFGRMAEFYSSKGSSAKRQVVHWHITGAPAGGSDSYQTAMQHGACEVSEELGNTPLAMRVVRPRPREPVHRPVPPGREAVQRHRHVEDQPAVCGLHDAWTAPALRVHRSVMISAREDLGEKQAFPLPLWRRSGRPATVALHG